ncbi:50S ribosomal protein L23 [Candidatus Falkowbacteria bacterium RIFCSPLOWO2_12_FULL_45_10]|uniref:Large ribosomal subunit protein uL23 n=1 Tax=Candidatus Falkowbacteria bacterium RIFCSPLOWO2_12_FULL_45_10 TaxID=1797990 RepID=A0A1F5RXN1_9BACT|nr:MAG: 50S ribosomal protein L23 [Candidatus Falkowbacteria bacterium RIFCSPLOWO2_12_FULL_45_10]
MLVKPLVTEKAAKIGTQNKYAFVVAIAANKIMIARSIEQVYGVKPVKVNIIRLKGKIVSSRRLRGKRKDWKKAIITLPAGKNINIYEGV